MAGAVSFPCSAGIPAQAMPRRRSSSRSVPSSVQTRRCAGGHILVVVHTSTRPLLPQLRRQMIHQRGLAAAADKRRQSRPDLQQFPQFHPVIRPFPYPFFPIYHTFPKKTRPLL